MPGRTGILCAPAQDCEVEHNMTIRGGLLAEQLLYGDCVRLLCGLPAIACIHKVPAVFIFVQRLQLQESTSPVPPPVLIATNDLVASILYEAVQEALHEVCMHLRLLIPMQNW
jgi:hypothetical protein